MTIKITKQLATVEDLAIGTGTVVQERNGVPLTLTKIDLITKTALASEAASKGAALVSMEGGPTVELAVSNNKADIVNRVIRVTSIAAMEAYSAPIGYVFSLNAGGRSGTFDVVAGDFSTEVTNDSFQAVYVALSDDATGATKVAKRRYDLYVNIEWFGATGDGSFNNTTRIQSAIDNHRQLHIPKGDFHCSGSLNISSPVELYGVPNFSKITHSSTTGNLLNVTSNGFSSGPKLVNLVFGASVTKTAGFLVDFDDCYYGKITDCVFEGGYDGLGISGTPSQYMRVSDCRFANISHDNISVTANYAGQGCVDVVFDNILISGTSPAVESVTGIFVRAAGDLSLNHIQTFYCTTGLRLEPDNIQDNSRVQALFVSDSFFDTASGQAIVCAPENDGEIQLFKIYDTWCASHDGDGIVLGLSAGSLKQIDLVNVVCSANGGNGLVINGPCEKVNVTACSFSANTNNGIAVAAGVSGVKIEGSTCGPSGQFGGNGGRGILFSAGTSSNVLILGNDLTGNVGESMLFGPSGADCIIQNNIGYKTVAFGEAGITAGDVTVVIPHGLAKAPVKGQATVGFIANNVGKFVWIDSIDATNITLSIDSVSGNSVFVGWKISILQ